MRDLLSMGSAMVVLVVGGLGLGWLVDRALGSFPAFVLAGLGLGIVATCLYVARIMKRFS